MGGLLPQLLSIYSHPLLLQSAGCAVCQLPRGGSLLVTWRLPATEMKLLPHKKRDPDRGLFLYLQQPQPPLFLLFFCARQTLMPSDAPMQPTIMTGTIHGDEPAVPSTSVQRLSMSRVVASGSAR